MRIVGIESTDLFLGPAAAPRQVVRVTVASATAGEPVRVRVEGPTVDTPHPATTTALAAGERQTVEVGVRIAAPTTEGSPHQVTAIAGGVTAYGEIRAAATGWTMWMVSHFHYDPVWWNTQRGFTELWQQLPDVPKSDKLRPPFVRTAFDLVRAHLDAARHDDDYRFVLAEVDYLKPYWDVFVDDRADLRRMLREGRVELVGGMYNEPNTNLTHPESTIRNTAYGVGYQRDVLGGDPRSAWMLDVFGHDPAFPGLMADAGLTSSAWARGPFHHIGAKRHTGDITRMQFPSEFEWISPSGRGLLTAYMANHYVAGWDVERKQTLEEALDEAYAQYRELRKVAATPNVMLPVGHDHNIPSRWCTEIHREWAKRYVWPRFVMGLPRDFFAAVRAASPRLSPQTRDMNPVYTGKDVSYIDTKQAQRAIETIVLGAERLGTLAALLGARYPTESLEKAWRLLAYGAHHDAVTGTESDQVYLDLLAGWREAYELGVAARRDAASGLADRADTTGDGQAVLVANSLSWSRAGVVAIRSTFAAPGPSDVTVLDEDGHRLPAVAEGITRHPDGGIAEIALSVPAQDVPALGYRVFRVTPSTSGRAATGWRPVSSLSTIKNDFFAVRVSRAGGALSSIVDRRTGRELLRDGGLGGEIVVQDEYPDHPYWGEGPWHLLTKGPGRGLDDLPAEVRAEHSAAGSRLTSTVTLDELRITREVLLWQGAERIDFRTHVDGSIGQDRLLRVRFDLDLPGALPVSDVGFAAVGRSFGFPDADTAEHLWTLDNPAHTWAGLSATARIRLHAPDGRVHQHAIGVAEVISDQDPRALLVALVQHGVTATSTRPDGPRYGSLDADSNLPDVRIVIGENAFVADLLDEPRRATLAAAGRVFIPAELSLTETWVPGADLRDARALPILVVTVDGLDALIADLDDAVVEVRQEHCCAAPFTDCSVALVNHGTPGFVVRSDGSLFLSLMRACTGWPSGVWIDGPRRTVPDGSGFALQHWTHTFRYSLVAGPGDWRRAGFVQAGQELNHPLVATPVPSAPGELPARASLGAVEPSSVVLTTLKPRAGSADEVTVRLYESAGVPARARIQLHGGLRAASATNVLEEPTSETVSAPSSAASASLVSSAPLASSASAGAIVVDLPPAGVVTVAARPGLTLARDGKPAVEPVQPIYTRYWLHNKGPAPIGDLPVSVHLTPAADLPATVRVTVASSTATTTGTVELDVPPGIEVSPPGPYPYDLTPGTHHHVDLRLTGSVPGRHHLAARIRDPLGQLLEDVATLTVPPSTPDGPPTVQATLEPTELTATPGETTQLTLTLHNPTSGPLRGEIQLLSPYGTWGDHHDELQVDPWIQAYNLPAAATTIVKFNVTAHPHARPGAGWWALARITGFGEVTYTPAVSLTITPS